MKNRFRLFRRSWGTYYCEDLETKTQESLKTRDKAQAHRLVAALNETSVSPAFSLHLARVYWRAGDPAAASRTWQHVMDEILKQKREETRHRWETAVKDKALDRLRDRVVLETQAEHFLRALEQGTVSTNIYLRRIHNFAMDMGWLPWPVLPKKRWPAFRFKEKRGITRAEHESIVGREALAQADCGRTVASREGVSHGQRDLALSGSRRRLNPFIPPGETHDE